MLVRKMYVINISLCLCKTEYYKKNELLYPNCIKFFYVEKL